MATAMPIPADLAQDRLRDARTGIVRLLAFGRAGCGDIDEILEVSAGADYEHALKLAGEVIEAVAVNIRDGNLILARCTCCERIHLLPVDPLCQDGE